MSQFRMGTLNVHFFTDVNGQSNVHHLAQLLKPMSFDALALQETLYTEKPPGVAPERHYHFKLLSNLLQLPHIAFCNTAHEFGNAILSRFPLKSSFNHCIEKIEGHDARGILAVQVDNEFVQDNDATLYVTHLDQTNEQLRLIQLDHFQNCIQGSRGLQLIVGDFNALTFEDYSDDYFNTHIRDVRQRNSWESPLNLVTNKMKEDGYHDCWREMNEDAVNDQAVTCVYKTRIDYIWRKGEMKNGWKMDECRIFLSEDATDHNGVLVTFVKSSN